LGLAGTGSPSRLAGRHWQSPPKAGNSTFRFKTKLLFIANALRGYHIGLNEEADGVWSIFFGDVLLAKLDERDYIIRE
jgi:hypothetical protein